MGHVVYPVLFAAFFGIGTRYWFALVIVIVTMGFLARPHESMTRSGTDAGACPRCESPRTTRIRLPWFLRPVRLVIRTHLRRYRCTACRSVDYRW